MSCADQKNPLQHDGTSQQQRQLAALQPAYAQVDERDIADWVVFASRFSAYLNYFSEQNLAAGTWEPFFNNDIASTFGSVAVQNINAYRQSIKERLDFLRDDDNDDELARMEAILGSLFSGMLTLSIALDSYTYRIPSDHALNGSLQNVISQKLQPALKKLFGYYKGGKSRKKSDGSENAALVIIRDQDFTDWNILGMPVYNLPDTLATARISSLWLDGKPDLQAFFESVEADSSIYGDEDATPQRRIRHAANHNLFVSLFDQFLGAYARFIKDAETALLDALSTFNAHPPHYTLFLTFLQLYRYAQDELNTITQRHLDFYYNDILRLSPKPAAANSAYLVVELGKGVNEYALAKGVAFKAGKDSLGKEVAYTLDAETVFNRAKVEWLMSVYRGAAIGIGGKAPADDIGSVNNRGRLFAAPVANSADGNGSELKTANKEWQPFVNKTFEDGKLISIDAPKAVVGFAVASPYLALAEGDREIQLKLSLAPVAQAIPANLHFEGYLTTAKEWLKVAVSATVATLSAGTSDALNLSITLTGDQPAVTPFVAKTHGGSFETSWPVLKIHLTNEDNTPYEYDALRDLQLTDVSLSVFAGVDSGADTVSGKTGLRQLQLSNEFGPIDPAKPFQPFGMAPKKGSAFVVGSEEFFKKPGASFLLKLKWLDLPSAGAVDYDTGSEGSKAPAVSVDVLAKGAWNRVDSSEELWIAQSSNKFKEEHTFPAAIRDLTLNNAKTDVAGYLDWTDSYGPYSVSKRNGYLRLVLNAGFGYEAYQKALAKYMVDAALRPSSAVDPGEAPYVPKLESISLHYKASVAEDMTTVDASVYEKKHLSFYHIHPFGEAEQHPYLNPDEDVMLLPQFEHSDDSLEAKRDSGELYIGLTGLSGSQAVNILFGVMEGTSDPLLVKPEDHVSWHYLSKNAWRLFDEQDISDGTAQLVQTGIISFSIPEDATTDNTLLPAGYLWIKASVNAATMAVCKLVGIDAQAAVVTFSDNGNASDFLNSALPAGTISRLKISVPSIKKVVQPYASFGGRTSEEQTHYYMRVSERLRHKDRAITIWDYEHLILEAFPSLHRVKCLSHTSYEQLENGTIRYNEGAPGHVTIITIPSLEQVNTVNPLRPYTSESVLEQIEVFVKERISCHVTPHVVHPLFEEVALEFALQLADGYDDFNYYQSRLQDEICAYLTPWVSAQNADIRFGGKVSKSVLINFIEERSYVDYIRDVKMYHRTDADPSSVADHDEISASTGMSILVSVPASKHTITQVVEPDAAAVSKDCKDPYNAKKSVS